MSGGVGIRVLKAVLVKVCAFEPASNPHKILDNFSLRLLRLGNPCTVCSLTLHGTPDCKSRFCFSSKVSD